MRFYEISSGLRVPVSEEEQELIDLITEQGKVDEQALDERQCEVARLMVSRGLLVREYSNDTYYVKPNGLTDLWRL